MRLIKKIYKKKTYFAAPENLRNGCGPCSKTFSAVSEKPSTGVFVDLHILCDVFT